MSFENISSKHPVIFFDGACRLCNAAINFIIRHDRHKRFRYAFTGEDNSFELPAELGDAVVKNNTIVLLVDGKIFTRSEAVFRILKIMGGWPAFMRIFSVLPLSLTNKIYDLVAANRKKWFGRYEKCMMPDDSIQDLFVMNNKDKRH